MAVLDLGEGDGWPDDRGSEAAQLEAMAEWLLARLDRLRRHPRSAAMCDEITAAVRRGRGLEWVERPLCMRRGSDGRHDWEEQGVKHLLGDNLERRAELRGDRRGG